MAIRYQDFEVTTSLPRSMPNSFQGVARESVVRYSDRPAKLVAYELRDAAFMGQLRSFTVNEVDLIDADGSGTSDDAVTGRSLFSYVAPTIAASDDNAGPVVPILTAAHDVDNNVTNAGQAAPVFFNAKTLEVEVDGGVSATDAITIRLYYESAGDYRF